MVWLDVDSPSLSCSSLANNILKAKAIYSPAFDEILEVLRPLDACFWLVLQCRDRLTNDVGQKIDQTSTRVHLGAVCGEREAMLCDFEKCHAQAPHVASDGVALSSDSLRGHVVRRANEGVGITFRPELAGDAKVAKLYLPILAKQNVAWLDISMDDAMGVQISEAVQDTLCDLSEDLLTCTTAELLNLAIYCIKRSTFAELHSKTDGARTIVNEGAPVSTDMIASAILVERHFSYNLFLDVWVRICSDDLQAQIRASIADETEFLPSEQRPSFRP